MIRRIDAEVLPKLNGGAGRSTNEVRVNHTKGVAALFAGLKARANEKFK
jgi:hypothetical protein